MPKMKTHKGTAKRVRKTGSGNYKFKRAGKRHGLRRQSKLLRREKRHSGLVQPSEIGSVRKLLPNG
ncbi:MAG: 50S ribosomal protein L35 [Bdellovibrionota bacterium]